MIVEELMMQVEALVFASEKAITPMEITSILAELDPIAEINIDSINSCIHSIKEKYDSEYYPFTVKEIGGGIQFLTKKEYHPTIAKLNGDKFLKRLSNAALETLAIIAYKQPITKPDVEYIRGVNCDYSVQKLLEKELIVITGRNEDAVGKPLLYCTSKNFMDYLGINSMDDLPRLKEVIGEDIVIPTNAEEAIPENDNTVMVVSQDGELQEVEAMQTTTDALPNVHEWEEKNDETVEEVIPETEDRHEEVPEYESELPVVEDTTEEMLETPDDAMDTEDEKENTSNSEDEGNKSESKNNILKKNKKNKKGKR